MSEIELGDRFDLLFENGKITTVQFTQGHDFGELEPFDTELLNVTVRDDFKPRGMDLVKNKCGLGPNGTKENLSAGQFIETLSCVKNLPSSQR